MSIRYTIEDLMKKRDAAGLGTLSMGVCALSGEIVSSTPIPGSRCGGEGQDTSEYGGYLLGEGMTPAVALYLANLHNHFPSMAKAALSGAEEWEDSQGAEAYLAAIQKSATAHGWDIFEGPLGEWIDAHLKRNPEPIRTGSRVTVYDRFRFAIPLKAIVRELSGSNDGAMVVLLESNNSNFPVGSEVWVHLAQLQACTPTGE